MIGKTLNRVGYSKSKIGSKSTKSVIIVKDLNNESNYRKSQTDRSIATSKSSSTLKRLELSLDPVRQISSPDKVLKKKPRQIKFKYPLTKELKAKEDCSATNMPASEFYNKFFQSKSQLSSIISLMSNYVANEECGVTEIESLSKGIESASNLTNQFQSQFCLSIEGVTEANSINKIIRESDLKDEIVAEEYINQNASLNRMLNYKQTFSLIKRDLDCIRSNFSKLNEQSLAKDSSSSPGDNNSAIIHDKDVPLIDEHIFLLDITKAYSCSFLQGISPINIELQPFKNEKADIISKFTDHHKCRLKENQLYMENSKHVDDSVVSYSTDDRSQKMIDLSENIKISTLFRNNALKTLSQVKIENPRKDLGISPQTKQHKKCLTSENYIETLCSINTQLDETPISFKVLKRKTHNSSFKSFALECNWSGTLSIK